MKIISISAICLAALTSIAAAAPVDLSTWVVDNSTPGAGTWSLETGNNGVVQSRNGAPTVFHNNENSQGKALAGTIKVKTASDDDYFGFVLGFTSGDFANATADYLLIDWKQADQNGYRGLGKAGLAISLVSGVVGDNSGAWWHDPTKNVTELARATNLGSTGWADNTEYSFKLTFTNSLVQVRVDDVLELSISGSFSDGSFGFYNYSQQSVRYAGLEEDVLPPPVSAVPLPAALPLMGAGLGIFGLMALRRRRT